MVKKKSCKCNYLFSLIALILTTMGLYSIVQGFFVQGMGSFMSVNWLALGHYSVGILFLGLGKLSKLAAYRNCSISP